MKVTTVTMVMVDQKNKNMTHLRRLVYFILTGIFLLPYGSLQAKKWLDNIDPSLSVESGYSDNIDLSENKTGSFYTIISPHLHIDKQGSRVRTQVDYTLQGIAYANETNASSNQVNNILYANILSELVKNSIFLDVDGTITQQVLDSSKTASDDNVSGSDNLTDTYTYSINPYWKNQWSNWANSTLSYDYNEVRYGSDSDSNSEFNRNNNNNSTGQNAQLLVESGREFNQIFWNLDFDYEHINYENAPNTKSSINLINLGYHYTQQLSFQSFIGYEKYDETTGTSEGSILGVGAIWEHSQTTYVEMNIGHRFYGAAYDFTLEHTQKRWTINALYEEGVTSNRDQIRNNNSSYQTAAFAPDDDVIDSQTNTSLNDSNDLLYLSRRFEGNINYKMKRSGLSLGLYQERKNYDQRINNKQDTGYNLGWTYRLAKRMDTSLNFNWLDRQYDDKLTGDTQQWGVRWMISRRLSRELNASFELSHTEQTADFDRNEFEENRILLRINKTF